MKRLIQTTNTLLFTIGLALIAACGPSGDNATSGAAADPGEPETLKQAFSGHFLVGGAVNVEQTTGAAEGEAALAASQFNTITPENTLKWESVHPEPGTYDFEGGDALVAFGEANGMFIVGHTLIWHSQTPNWVFTDEVGNPKTREALLALMEEHISTVVGHYRGRIQGWDVVNEALNGDGTMRESAWQRIIGDDFIEKAFEFAHAADPDAELYYNDYSLTGEAKRRGALAVIQGIRDAGIPVGGVGEQIHATMGHPSLADIEATIMEFAGAGLPVMFTELDVDVLPFPVEDRGADISLTAELHAELNPYVDGMSDEAQQALAERYADIFGVFVKHAHAIERVTFWGVTDAATWLNNWPIGGRTNHPLLFDRDLAAKPAFGAVMATAE